MWWPNQAGGQEFEESFSNKGFTRVDCRAEGIGMFSKAFGQRNSSTRMEIAGAVMDVTTLEPCEPVRRPLRDMCVARTGALETETE